MDLNCWRPERLWVVLCWLLLAVIPASAPAETLTCFEVRITEPSALSRGLDLDLLAGDQLREVRIGDLPARPLCGGLQLLSAESHATLGKKVLVQRRRGSQQAWLQLPVGAIAQQLQVPGDELWERFAAAREQARTGQFEAARAVYIELANVHAQQKPEILAAALATLEADFNFAAQLALVDQLINAREARGDARELVLAARTVRAKLLMQMRRLDESRRMVENHLGQPSLPPMLQAMNLQLKGALTFLGGDRPGAIVHYEAAQAIYAAQAPRSMLRIASLSNLGLMATQGGDMPAASAYYEQAVALGSALIPDSIVHARNLLAMGLVAGNLHHNARAIGYLQAANSAFDRLQPNGPEQAQAQSVLAELFSHSGAHVEAEIILRAVLRREMQRAPDARTTLESRSALAYNLVMQGRAEEAVAEYEALLATAGDEDRSHLEADLRLNHAWALASAGRRLEAIAVAEVARQLYLERKRTGLQLASTELLLASWRLDEGQTELAGPMLQSVLRNLQQHAPGGVQELNCEFQLGRWHQAQKRPDAALRHYQRALELFDALMIAQQTAVELRDRWGAMFSEAFRAPIELLVQRGETAAAFALYARYRQAEGQFGFAGTGGLAPSPRVALKTGPETLIQQVAAGLDREELLLAWVWRPEALIAFSLDSAGQLAAHRWSLDSKALAARIDALYTLSGDPGSELPILLETAAAVREAVLGPLQAQVAAYARLRLVTDGPLQRLAFAALPDPAQTDRYLIETHALSHQATGLPQAQPASQVRTLAMVAFGDPRGAEASSTRDRFVLRRDGGEMALPAARREARQVAAVFAPSAKAFVGAAATVDQLKAALSQSSRLHLATHAVVDPRRPFDSWIALAPSAGNPADRLSAREIASLSNAPDLVVLSACASATGADGGGAGVLGLVRAWQLAGTRELLATQWAVADRPSAQLMRDFWLTVHDGSGIDTALAVAQRAWISQARAGWFSRVGRRLAGADAQPEQALHPFWWAGFVVLR